MRQVVGSLAVLFVQRAELFKLALGQLLDAGLFLRAVLQLQILQRDDGLLDNGAAQFGVGHAKLSPA